MVNILRASDFFQDWWAEVTHGAKKMVGHFLKYGPKHIKLTTVDIWVVYSTNTCMHVCILTADYSVKPVLSGHSKKKKTNYRLMQVKSIAECSKGSILQYF